MITLAVYLIFTIATAFSWNFFSFVVFRFLRGAGIGGEYSTIYSAVDELIPARLRGQVALAISGSYWGGAALGSLVAVFLLNSAFLGLFYSWRVAFGVGAVLGIYVLLIRRYVPESPRWLATHGRNEEAEGVMDDIEGRVKEYTDTKELPSVGEDESITIEQRKSIGFTPILRAMFRMYPKRTVLGLMGTQTFLYNAVLFTYGLILSTYYGVPGENVGYYIAILAVGNLAGPLLLGRLFDRIGRVPMIAGCYITSGVLLAVSGYLFHQHVLSGVTLTAIWGVMFFFASSAASAAYLTVSEVFPMEIRAMAIALFYGIATGIGGITGPIVFGQLIGTGSRSNLLIGFGIAAGLMIAAAVTELVLGVRAEQRSLEDVATPLTAIKEQTGASQ
jgi:MFS family permease